MPITFLCPGAGAMAEPPSPYSFADQCRTLRIGSGSVARSGAGYVVQGGSTEPFYMKAPQVMRGMGLDELEKRPAPLEELREKGLGD